MCVFEYIVQHGTIYVHRSGLKFAILSLKLTEGVDPKKNIVQKKHITKHKQKKEETKQEDTRQKQ